MMIMKGQENFEKIKWKWQPTCNSSPGKQIEISRTSKSYQVWLRDLVSMNSVEEELRTIPTSISDIHRHACINKCAPSTTCTFTYMWAHTIVKVQMHTFSEHKCSCKNKEETYWQRTLTGLIYCLRKTWGGGGIWILNCIHVFFPMLKKEHNSMVTSHHKSCPLSHRRQNGNPLINLVVPIQ